ncbi:MAG TPA: hypothetical protein ENJ08_03345 [Gammaproteobacteria bacterium]|nr:hypothetical protein [Gammaproteobacteria bacterium]
MKRILYFSGYSVTIFHWENEKCIAIFTFFPDEDGFDKFSTYLKSSINTPIRMLVDLIEEDFNKQSIPHVSAADRKSIVSRIINRQYRKSRDYFYYRVTGREKTGRRDDKLLFCVLSNPDIFSPWLDILKKSNTSVSGIWSLPLLSQSIYPHLHSSSRSVLLVSQQVPGNLRQTLFIGGSFEHSRSSVVSSGDTETGEYIAVEVEQTIRFLSNQHHIGFDEKIEIHIISDIKNIKKIKSKCKDTNLLTFIYHSHDDIKSRLKCSVISSDNKPDYSGSIFSYICASLKLPIGHYGNAEIFSVYYQQVFSYVVKTASAFSLVMSLLFSFSYISESYIFDNEALTLNGQAQAINKDYEKKLSSLESRLKLTKAMQSSVLLTEKIRSLKSVSPQNFMVDVSRILTRSGMNDTEISKLSWQQYQLDDFQAENSKVKNHIDYADKVPVRHHAVISGFMQVSKISLKKSVDKVNAIAEAFRNNQLIYRLRLNKLPVDVRSKSSIENEASSSSGGISRKDNMKGQFEIELLMDARKS